MPSLADGGAERVTLNLIQYLAKHEKCAVDLVLVNVQGQFLKDVPTNVRIIDLRSKRSLLSIPKLVRYMRNERPQTLVSVMDYVNVIAFISQKLSFVPIRMIGCVHINLSAQQENTNPYLGKVVLPLIKITHRWANRIIAVSEGCASDFVQVTGIKEEKVVTIYNPVITDEISVKAAEPVKHRWLVDKNEHVILAVGRLAHQKNYPLLLNAFAQLRETQKAKLIILGEGEKRAELETLSKELDISQHVDFHGFTTNPYAYMSKADLFVLSSHYEALPTVLIEAMYCGAKLVATDCPSGPREILADGKYGTLVPINDPDSLAIAMILALKNENFSQAKNACDRFKDEVVIKQYLKEL